MMKMMMMVMVMLMVAMMMTMMTIYEPAVGSHRTLMDSIAGDGWMMMLI